MECWHDRHVSPFRWNELILNRIRKTRTMPILFVADMDYVRTVCCGKAVCRYMNFCSSCGRGACECHILKEQLDVLYMSQHDNKDHIIHCLRQVFVETADIEEYLTRTYYFRGKEHVLVDVFGTEMLRGPIHDRGELKFKGLAERTGDMVKYVGDVEGYLLPGTKVVAGSFKNKRVEKKMK